MFCAYTPTPLPPSFLRQASSAVKGAAIPTVAGRRVGSGMSWSSRSQYLPASSRVPHSFQLPTIAGLRVIEHLHPRQRLALQQLERGAAARGQVIDLVVEAELGQ